MILHYVAHVDYAACKSLTSSVHAGTFYTELHAHQGSHACMLNACPIVSHTRSDSWCTTSTCTLERCKLMTTSVQSSVTDCRQGFAALLTFLSMSSAHTIRNITWRQPSLVATSLGQTITKSHERTESSGRSTSAASITISAKETKTTSHRFC